MKRRHRPWFVILFGVLLGLMAIGYGSIMLLLDPSTPVVDCGAKCATENALFDLLGQPLSNLVFGLAWVAAGLFLVIVVVRTERRSG